MPRYRSLFSVIPPASLFFEPAYQYLLSQGYEYIQLGGENVFKKGHGFFCAPRYIKVSCTADTVLIEAWMKYSLLPGVYVGEIGLTGFVGAAVRGPLKANVARLESMLQAGGGIWRPGAV